MNTTLEPSDRVGQRSARRLNFLFAVESPMDAETKKRDEAMHDMRDTESWRLDRILSISTDVLGVGIVAGTIFWLLFG